MTDEEAAVLSRLEQTATPGPWEARDGMSAGQDIIAPNEPKVRLRVAALGGQRRDENAALIVAARNALPDLLADCAADRARIAELERALGEARYEAGCGSATAPTAIKRIRRILDAALHPTTGGER